MRCRWRFGRWRIGIWVAAVGWVLWPLAGMPAHGWQARLDTQRQLETRFDTVPPGEVSTFGPVNLVGFLTESREMWGLSLQPRQDALQPVSGAAAGLPLHRMAWSLSEMGGRPMVWHLLQPGSQEVYPLLVSNTMAIWWRFAPEWTDPPGDYAVPVDYLINAAVMGTTVTFTLAPNPYDPTQDGPLHLVGRLSIGNVSVTLKLFPPTGPAVIRAALAGSDGAFDLVWDGTVAGGGPAPEGVWNYIVEWADGFNTWQTPMGTLWVVRRPAGAGALGVTVRNARTGQPASGARVEVRDAVVDSVLRAQAAGPDGRAHFTSLAPGDYHVVAGAPGFREARRRVTARPSESAMVDLALEPAAAPVLDLHLASVGDGPLRPGQAVRVRARVTIQPSADGATGSGGAAYRDGEVLLRLEPGLHPLPETWVGLRAGDRAAVRSGPADVGGEVVWRLGGLDDGEQVMLEFLCVVAPAALGSRRLGAEATGRFTPAAGGRGADGRTTVAAPVRVEMETAAAAGPADAPVVGRVVDPEGQGIAGVWVATADGQAVRSGPGGWFAMALAPGGHVLFALPKGLPWRGDGEAITPVHPGEVALVDVRAGALTHLTLVLRSAEPAAPVGPWLASGSIAWEQGAAPRAALAATGLTRTGPTGGVMASGRVRLNQGVIQGGVEGAALAWGGHRFAYGVLDADRVAGALDWFTEPGRARREAATLVATPPVASGAGDTVAGDMPAWVSAVPLETMPLESAEQAAPEQPRGVSWRWERDGPEGSNDRAGLVWRLPDPPGERPTAQDTVMAELMGALGAMSYRPPGERLSAWIGLRRWPGLQNPEPATSLWTGLSWGRPVGPVELEILHERDHQVPASAPVRRVSKSQAQDDAAAVPAQGDRWVLSMKGDVRPQTPALMRLERLTGLSATAASRDANLAEAGTVTALVAPDAGWAAGAGLGWYRKRVDGSAGAGVRESYLLAARQLLPAGAPARRTDEVLRQLAAGSDRLAAGTAADATAASGLLPSGWGVLRAGIVEGPGTSRPFGELGLQVPLSAGPPAGAPGLHVEAGAGLRLEDERLPTPASWVRLNARPVPGLQVNLDGRLQRQASPGLVAPNWGASAEVSPWEPIRARIGASGNGARWQWDHAVLSYRDAAWEGQMQLAPGRASLGFQMAPGGAWQLGGTMEWRGPDVQALRLYRAGTSVAHLDGPGAFALRAQILPETPAAAVGGSAAWNLGGWQPAFHATYGSTLAGPYRVYTVTGGMTVSAALGHLRLTLSPGQGTAGPEGPWGLFGGLAGAWQMATAAGLPDLHPPAAAATTLGAYWDWDPDLHGPSRRLRLEVGYRWLQGALGLPMTDPEHGGPADGWRPGWVARLSWWLAGG